MLWVTRRVYVDTSLNTDSRNSPNLEVPVVAFEVLIVAMEVSIMFVELTVWAFGASILTTGVSFLPEEI